MSTSPGDPGWGGGAWGPTPYGNQPRTTSRNGLVWALGALVVVLLVALAGVVGYLLASGDEDPAVAAGVTTSSPEPTPAVPTTEQRPSTPAAAPAAAPAADPDGDLGLATSMSRPSCDGRGIVVLYSAVTPGAYAQEISSALAQNPGASYLRTDMACPSLRPRDDNGNVIYAVYRPSGYTRSQLCADVRAAGAPAYGRWLDTTSDPSALVTC